MHVPVYPLKGGNLTAEDFTAQLAAIRDSLPDRSSTLSAMDAVQELVGGQDMPVLKKQPKLARPLLELVNTIIETHEGRHEHVGMEQGLNDIQRMGAAQNLREELVRAGVHLSAHEDRLYKLRIAPHTRAFRTAESPNGRGLRITEERKDAGASLRIFNPDGAGKNGGRS